MGRGTATSGLARRVMGILGTVNLPLAEGPVACTPLRLVASTSVARTPAAPLAPVEQEPSATTRIETAVRIAGCGNQLLELGLRAELRDRFALCRRR